MTELLEDRRFVGLINHFHKSDDYEEVRRALMAIAKARPKTVLANLLFLHRVADHLLEVILNDSRIQRLPRTAFPSDFRMMSMFVRQFWIENQKHAHAADAAVNTAYNKLGDAVSSHLALAIADLEVACQIADKEEVADQTSSIHRQTNKHEEPEPPENPEST